MRRSELGPEPDNHKRLLHAIEVGGVALLATAIMITKNNEHAKDALQNAYLKAWSGVDRFRGESEIHTWLYRAVINSSIDIIRKERKFVAVEDPEVYAPGKLVDESNPESAAIRKEEREEYLRLLNMIPNTTYRAVTFLRYEDYTIEEISLLFDRPEGTVKNYISRGRDYIREMKNQKTPRDGELSEDN